MDSLRDILGFILIPLSWLPPDLYEVAEWIVIAITVVFIGRLFKWLWDVLPFL